MTEAPRAADEIRASVRSRYAAVATRDSPGSLPIVREPCCGPATASDGSAEPATCCDYSAEELSKLPAGANLGLGCGNPSGLASLRPGEVVVDLGSGGGVDCFLAGDRVGPQGHVIGVDMTPEMLARARGIARKAGRANVEFRLGEIEHLPIADGSVDVVLSNCVINLAPDKSAVYREVFRVLRPGGRLVVSDMLATRPIPLDAQIDLERWSACSTGALSVPATEEILRGAGFYDIRIALAAEPKVDESSADRAEIGVVSGVVRAVKPT